MRRIRRRSVGAPGRRARAPAERPERAAGAGGRRRRARRATPARRAGSASSWSSCTLQPLGARTTRSSTPDMAGHVAPHDFYGSVDDRRRRPPPTSLLGSDTTCDKQADTAALLAPGPLRPRRGRRALRPQRLLPGRARASTPTDVVPMPVRPGAHRRRPDRHRRRSPARRPAGPAGPRTDISDDPPTCPPGAPLHLVLTFPDCWDGEHLDSEDHASHATYSTDGACPEAHPVHIPQLDDVGRLPDLGRRPRPAPRVGQHLLRPRRLLQRLGPRRPRARGRGLHPPRRGLRPGLQPRGRRPVRSSRNSRPPTERARLARARSRPAGARRLDGQRCRTLAGRRRVGGECGGVRGSPATRTRMAPIMPLVVVPCSEQ